MGSSQFSLRQMLVWMSGAAAMLALGRWIASRQDDSFAGFAFMMAFVAALALVVAVVSLPMVIPSVALVLGERKRNGVAARLAAMIVMAMFIPFLIAFAMVMIGGRYSLTEAAWWAANAVVPLQTGLIATLAAGLVVVRLCGFRLYREGSTTGATAEMVRDVQFALAALAPEPWWCGRFTHLALAMGFVASALLLLFCLS